VMFVILATVERASSLLDRVWGVFVLGLTLITSALVVVVVVAFLGLGSLPPGLARARPWIAALGVITVLTLLGAYLTR
jgi:hypothetical protein